ncbi:MULTISPECIES: C-terminal binding protein [Sporosarcina]|uniref:C-terminal binding protein n=1 Tax=Sporosarcina TaxID=1569 RepID=UPI00129B7972|nr:MULTISPECIES: C-terminal binding protein [Sporosarcina]GKV64810.1 D-isomer specific 2-hydroxyacid dehydrogenase family protein [Sporosarcina sp. NCCP-2331]GLB54920.1 D-isomer specific 2-hydroxyacid dehydrogenase family protein [Sporosarcina sp. NCCP-2378]
MKDGKKLVWILDDEWTEHHLEEELFNQNGFTLKVSTSATLSDDLAEYGPAADGVIVQVGFNCEKRIIDQLDSCKVIAVYGVGFNHVDIEAAAEKEIPVCNVPDYCVEEVADHTIALMLAVSRRIKSYSRQVENGKWDALETLPFKRFKDMTIGLFGFGRISQLVAKKLQTFGSRIIAFDKYADRQVFDELGVTSVSMKELLTQSDLLSLHIPITPETENIMNSETLQLMPKGAFLINTCRGGVVNEKDLAAAIAAGQIGGAGLDVLKEEPPRQDNPLLQQREVLITPHCSYISENSVATLKQRTCTLILDGVDRDHFENVVNLKTFAN